MTDRNDPSRVGTMTEAESAILAELRLVGERVASLATELRARRSRGRKRAVRRTVTLAAKSQSHHHEPTEIDMARARKHLRMST